MAKFCANCGEPVEEYQQVCLKCGALLKTEVAKETVAPAEEGSAFGWGLLSFCIPLVGLILGITWKNDKPRTAKICLTAAIVSFVLNIVSTILLSVIGALAGGF